MSFRKSLLAAAAAIVLTSVGPAHLAAEETKSPEEKAAIEKIIKDYLMTHPEVIEEAMTALEKKKADEAALAQKTTITEKAALLFSSTRQVVLGNPKGDVTIVEFFDYNCGYCKRALPDMISLLNEDKNLRFVLKEFPVLGQGSIEAAQVAVAVNHIAPARYMEFHKQLLGARGEANKARAIEAAVAAGVDKAKLEAELANPEIAASIEEVYALANGLGLTGTPSYVVGETVVPGAIGLDRLKQKIADARNCDSKKC